MPVNKSHSFILKELNLAALSSERKCPVHITVFCNDSVAWNYTRLRVGVKCIPHNPRPVSVAGELSYLPVCGNIPTWNLFYYFIYLFKRIHINIQFLLNAI